VAGRRGPGACLKYRHSFHAGNFADVHKHVTLLALLDALQRKDKGFLFLDTHAGRGAYRLPDAGASEVGASVERLMLGRSTAPELTRYVEAITAYRASAADPRAYPGSPLLAARHLRPQDRAVFVEAQIPEARALERGIAGTSHARVETGDGFERLKAHVPPRERRGLVLIDPPYEETSRDFTRAAAAVGEVLQRFETAVVVLWYPIKRAADLAPWHAALARDIERPALLSELWLYPMDSRVSLNGSGLVIVNPPYRVNERMQAWLPELASALDPERRGGMRLRWLGTQR
jgi:23S rRNA (adenine2030-N6)-methyltransferase